MLQGYQYGQVEGGKWLDLRVKAYGLNWIHLHRHLWSTAKHLQKPLCRVLGKSRGSTAAAGEALHRPCCSVTAYNGQGCAEPWWNREVGGKQDALPGPHLLTKTCCARWGGTRRGFNLPQL